MDPKNKSTVLVVVLLLIVVILLGVLLPNQKVEISKSDISGVISTIQGALGSVDQIKKEHRGSHSQSSYPISANSSHIELEVWPRSAVGKQPLIKYNSRNHSSWYPWVVKINDFLKEYRRPNETHANGTKNRVICNNHTRLAENWVCDVPIEKFYPCTYANKYSYDQAGACVFLKLNKILNWKPQTYNWTANLPGNMPKDLKQHIKSIGALYAPNVWVSCGGESPTDVNNIGPVQYIPRRGFPASYYPFTNKKGYLSPLVAVHFQKPRKGVVINIECKAWAKNIVHKNGGSVHFKLKVE